MPQIFKEADWQARTLPVQNFVLGVARVLVDNHQSIAVTAICDDYGTTILLCVAPDDLGKVIGKQGRTARSIRTVLQAASAKFGERFALNIQVAGSQALSSSWKICRIRIQEFDVFFYDT